MNRMVDRLKVIGITLELRGNYPWVYLHTVNGNKVTGRYRARHGWTIFIGQQDGTYKITDRREVFKKIRETLEERR